MFALITQGTRYDDLLVEAAAKAILEFWKDRSTLPKVIVPVPSLRRPALVPDFAARLARAINLPVMETFGLSNSTDLSLRCITVFSELPM